MDTPEQALVEVGGRSARRSVRCRCRPRRRLDCRKHKADLCRRTQTPRRRARGAGPHRRQLVHLPCELARRRALAGCRSTPSAESSAAGRPRSASRAGYPVTVSALAARNRWPPAGPRLSRCRRRAGGSHRRCRATMHGASWQHGAPSLASATVADKAGVDHTTIFPPKGGRSDGE